MSTADNLKEHSRDSRALLASLMEQFPVGSTVIVAFSGGVDSTVVLAAAAKSKAPARVIAVTADSESLPRRELAEAEALAATLQVEHRLLPTLELDRPEYRANDGSRCYYCKESLYSSLRSWLTSSELSAFVGPLGASEPNFYIADGLNLDDLGDVRPGRRAADEAGIKHPLVDAGLAKAAVRRIAEELGLPNAHKPAMACLSSRIPQGTAVTRERLSLIERAEDCLSAEGFSGFRLRLHELPDGRSLARIELTAQELPRFFAVDRSHLLGALRSLGFAFITVDAEGYRLGGTVREMETLVPLQRPKRSEDFR